MKLGKAAVACLLGAALSWAAAVSAETPTEPDKPSFADLVEKVDRLAAENKSLREQTDALSADLKRREALEEAAKDAAAKTPLVNWTAQLQADFYAFNQDQVNRERFGYIQNGEAFRRARIGAFGDFGPAEYRLEMDFALVGRPSFLDVYGGIHDIPLLGRVRVGHFFEPFSLERITSNRFTTFMERSLPDQPFAPARNLGIMANNTFADGYGAWGLGFFRTDSDAFGDDLGSEFESAVTGRVTALPWYDDETGSKYVHLGFAYSFRSANNNQTRFRAQPEARIGSLVPNVPFFVDTGAIPSNNFQLIGFEGVWVRGPLSFQSEYTLTPVDPIGQGSLLFSGYYATVSYFLTGEHRPYRKDNGTFDRVIPKRDFLKYSAGGEKTLEHGPGAWEIAFRVSHLDLDDGEVHGGRLTDVSAGLNWYMSPYMRVTMNYVHAFVDDFKSGKSEADIFGIRLGFEF